MISAIGSDVATRHPPPPSYEIAALPQTTPRPHRLQHTQSGARLDKGATLARATRPCSTPCKVAWHAPVLLLCQGGPRFECVEDGADEESSEAALQSRTMAEEDAAWRRLIRSPRSSGTIEPSRRCSATVLLPAASTSHPTRSATSPSASPIGTFTSTRA